MQVIPEAIDRREFLARMLWKSHMRILLLQKRDNFDAHWNTGGDEAKVISQLEMDALSLSMRVNMIRNDLKLPQAFETAFASTHLAQQLDQFEEETVTVAQASSAQHSHI